jgi:hypothetical protein
MRSPLENRYVRWAILAVAALPVAVIAIALTMP